MKQRKVPLRMCLGCQEMKPKRELLRIVKDRDNNISIDFTGKAQGRGAYICRSTECFGKAKKGKRLEKAFELPVSEAIYNTLEKQLEGSDG